MKKGKIFIDTQLPWGIKREELVIFLNESDFPIESAREIIERLTTPLGLLKKFSEQSISLRPDLKNELEEITLTLLSDRNIGFVDDLRNYFMADTWRATVDRYNKRFTEERNEF